ncbi:MAG: CapA family protein [Actinobacteria bacterium]|nr:CapA family protein [Actinomycetota bacterium]MBU4357747.1 CapA family protein [Actinomycetota bacterium]MBU4401963.1 CapA family protein [Actinomycetota bacterium]MBU4442045.1 CapA family protein [Actinomycetota bacterium]
MEKPDVVPVEIAPGVRIALTGFVRGVSKATRWFASSVASAFRTRRPLALLVVAIVLLVVVPFVLKATGSWPFRPRIYGVNISSTVDTLMRFRAERFLASRPDFEYVSEKPDILLCSQPTKGFNTTLVVAECPVEVHAGEKEITLMNKHECMLSYRERDKAVDEMEKYLRVCGDTPDVTFTAIGDILPARTVIKMMDLHGVNYPFERAAPYVRGADIVCGDLECPLSDRYEPPTEGMYLLAPSETINGLKLLGLNLVTLANNHSSNFGEDAFTDTLDLLKANSLEYVGGGMDRAEAYSPKYRDVRGLRFGFLDYNAIIGALDATDASPGVANIHLWPSFDDDPEDIEMVTDEIVEAKREADFLVVFFHWGKEYQQHPLDSVKQVAHKACDAGADLIIGTHPHCIQTIERYGNKFIFYSLGNFVFDQMTEEKTRTGIIVKLALQGAMISEINIIPYMIHDYCQPIVFEGNTGQYVLDEVLEISEL